MSRAMGARGDRRGDARGGSRRDRRRERPVATRDPHESSDEWTEEEGDVSPDVEAGGALARDGSRDASSSGGPWRGDATRERASRHASWSVPIRAACDGDRGELEPILKKTSRDGKRRRSSRRRGALPSFTETDDEYEAELDGTSEARGRHKMRARVVLGATLVLGLACATGITVTSAAAHRDRIAERVATFPKRFSSEAAGGPALRFPKRTKGSAQATSFSAHDAVSRLSGVGGLRGAKSSAAAEEETPPSPAAAAAAFGSEASFSDFRGTASAPTAGRAGLFLSPARFETGARGGETSSTSSQGAVEPSAMASALSRLREVPLLGRFLAVEANAEPSPREDAEDVARTSSHTFGGLSPNEHEIRSTSSYARDGLDDLFFPALGDGTFDGSNSASNERENDETGRKYLIGLTTSAGFGDQFKRVSTYAAMARELNRTLVVWPVFTSPHYDLDGPGPNARGPLFFEEYVRIAGDGATDDPNRLVSYRDPSLPRRVRDFPLHSPEACVTSNGEAVDVQFPVSADLSRAVIAKAKKASSYEEQVRALRRLGDGGDGGAAAETLCVASTFGDADYNKARHGETALAWKSLDFRPVGRFHHWWANAVDNMVLVAAARRSRENAGAGTRKKFAPGSNLGATESATDDDDDAKRLSSSVSSRTEPSFRVTSAYTALHWRRGDKCGRKSKRQASRNAGPAGHAFDARASGASQALLCDEQSYLRAPVLDLCVPLAPMYVATDDQDEAFLAHVKSKGCLLRSDVVVSPPETRVVGGRRTADALEDVDALVLDVMLVAGAEMSFTYGHTALARLYDRMRMSRGAPRSINVAADAEAFRRAFVAARAGSGAAAAAAATLGERSDELVAG